MDIKQRHHLDEICKEAIARLRKKYEDGQEQHGGTLYLKRGMLGQARQEADDLFIYLSTVAKQHSQLVKMVESIKRDPTAAEVPELCDTIIAFLS